MIKDIDFKFSKFSYLEEANVNRPIENEQYCNIVYDLIYTKALEKTLSQFFNEKSTSLDVENER